MVGCSSKIACKLLVDTDNALGSKRGDVDDGFALAYLMKAGATIAAISAVFGNTSEPEAFGNSRKLAHLCGFDGPMLRGAAGPRSYPADLIHFLSRETETLRVVALGPLTNIARAIDKGIVFSEVLCVGSNTESLGRWPPYWPHEFNFTKDAHAVRKVFESTIPLTIVPLNIARNFTFSNSDLAALTNPVGEYLFKKSQRWARLNFFLKARRAFPLWDLLAALYVTHPEEFSVRSVYATCHDHGWIQCGPGIRKIQQIVSFSSQLKTIALSTLGRV